MIKNYLISEKKKKYLLLIILFFVILLISFLYAAGIVRISFGSNYVVSILSPENITYFFNRGDNYTLDLNVSSSRELTGWNYTLEDLKHGSIVYNIFTPNTTFNAVRWSNRLTVFGKDLNNESFNSSVEFFISVNNSAPVIENVSDVYVCEKNYLSYFFNATTIDENSLIFTLNPQYPVNPFYASSGIFIDYTLVRFEIFSGTLTKDDAGGVNIGSKTYAENISVDDGQYLDSKSMNIIVMEVNNAPVIQDIGVHTIWTRGDNSNFYYQTIVNDSEDGIQNSGNFIFNISFLGIKLFNISQNGIMNFTAFNSTSVGVYYINVSVKDKGITNPHENINLCAQNGSSITSYKQFSLTVTNQNRQPNITSYYPINSSLSGSGSVIFYFNITTYDPDGTIPDVYWYVDDVLKQYQSGNLSDSYSYVFGCGISGVHTIKVRITDGEFNDSKQWDLSIQGVDCPIIPPGGGGGGGGGGGTSACTPKLGCSEWGVCQSLDSISSLDSNLSLMIKNKCSLNKWNDSVCGFQRRECLVTNNCTIKFSKLSETKECYYTYFPSCKDGIKNCHDKGCEILTDCGGPCPACPTCSDKIKNQGEENIDCGGPCPACFIELPYKTTLTFVYIFAFFLILILLIIIIAILRYYLKKREFERKINEIKQ